MPRIFKHLEAGYLQVNLMSTSAQINQVKKLYYTICQSILILLFDVTRFEYKAAVKTRQPITFSDKSVKSL